MTETPSIGITMSSPDRRPATASTGDHANSRRSSSALCGSTRRRMRRTPRPVSRWSIWATSSTFVENTTRANRTQAGTNASGTLPSSTSALRRPSTSNARMPRPRLTTSVVALYNARNGDFLASASPAREPTARETSAYAGGATRASAPAKAHDAVKSKTPRRRWRGRISARTTSTASAATRDPVAGATGSTRTTLVPMVAAAPATTAKARPTNRVTFATRAKGANTAGRENAATAETR